MYGLIIAVVELDINLFVYLKTGSVLYIIAIISASFFFIVITIISDMLDTLKENTEKLNDLTEKLKTAEDLSDIRLNVRELQRKVFK